LVFLNATLWLDKFNGTGSSDRELNYGMYIDSDFNNKTGIAGIDYKVDIAYNRTHIDEINTRKNIIAKVPTSPPQIFYIHNNWS
jgi:hypothetical protein